jgi:hypothetical protein
VLAGQRSAVAGDEIGGLLEEATVMRDAVGAVEVEGVRVCTQQWPKCLYRLGALSPAQPNRS